MMGGFFYASYQNAFRRISIVIHDSICSYLTSLYILFKPIRYLHLLTDCCAFDEYLLLILSYTNQEIKQSLNISDKKIVNTNLVKYIHHND